MKKAIVFAVALALTAAICVWYFLPKTFLRGTESGDISEISVFDGTNGRSFTVTNEDEIAVIVNNIQNVKMKRGKLSVGYMGYMFDLKFKDKKGNVKEGFILNGNSVIRGKLFFYYCDGSLCGDYITALEEKYVKEQ